MASIDIELRKSDLIRYYFHLLPRLRQNRIYTSVVFVGIVGFIVLGGDVNRPSDYGIAVFAAAVGAVAALLFGFALNCLVMLFSPMPGIVGKHSFTLLEHGLREATDVNDSFHPWAAVDDIGMSPQLITFSLNRKTMHFLLPRRDFPDQSAFEEFYRRARALKAASEAPNEAGTPGSPAGLADRI